jgi:putative ABC transport system permease protein
MIILKMSFRNIFRNKRRTVLTGMSMIGGFTLAVIFIGWADGTYYSIIDSFTRNQLGHIQIHRKGYLDRPSLYKTIDNTSRIADILNSTKGVDSWTPRLYSAGLASVGEKSTGVRIIGIDPGRENQATNIQKRVIKGQYFSEANSKQTILGKGLADILKAGVGDQVILLSQAADGSIANDLYAVAGIASSGDDLIDRMSFYLPLQEAQDLLVLQGEVHEIAINVKKLGIVRKMAKTIAKKIDSPELAVEPWQVFAKSFYSAMKADKEGMWITLLIIVIIVAVGVLNTVLMSVLERRREYGVLRAVGTKPGQIIRLVLWEVTILALSCIVIGTLLGLGANAYLSSHGLVLKQGFSYGGMTFSAMKAEINARSFIIPAVTVLVCAVLVSLLPAIKAAKTEPAKTMRIH